MGLRDIVKKGAFVDILRGMSVTGTYFVVDKVTVEYPKEKLNPYPRFRGAHALLSDPATGDTKCVACMLCPTICPSRCITVEGEQTPDGRSRPARFDIDLTRCIFCGLCEEVCPMAAIIMTRRYELATYDKADLLLDKEWLMANAVNAHKEVCERAEADEQHQNPVRPTIGDSSLAETIGRMAQAAPATRAAEQPARQAVAGWRAPGAPKSGFELLPENPEPRSAALRSFGGSEPVTPAGGPVGVKTEKGGRS